MKKILSFFIIVLISINIFPKNFTAKAEEFNEPISCKSINLVNIETGMPLYQKDPDLKVEPASTTKIMTYTIAVQNCKDLNGTMVTVSQDITDKLSGTESSLANIKNGETLSMYELLNCMMLPSGNDAAMVIANYIGGSGGIEAFVQMMNDKANELGCENTHFANPSGLHDPNHYTTANDMYKIALNAMNLPSFMEITSQTKHTIPQTNVQKSRTLLSTNKMMMQSEPKYYCKYVKGLKTGWHDQAGHCIVTSASKDGCNYICVAMGAPTKDEKGKELDNGAMLDTKKLYEWAFSNYSLRKISAQSQAVKEVNLKLAWNKDKIVLIPDKDLTLLLPKDAKNTDITYSNVNVKNTLYAPVKTGDIEGTADIVCQGKTFGTINITPREDVKRNIFITVVYVIHYLLTSIWFWLAVIFIFCLVKVLKTKARNKQRMMRHFRRKN